MMWTYDMDVWQVIVWCWECLSLYSFPHRFTEQINFLSFLYDAIKPTGNNMSLFFPSVFSAICQPSTSPVLICCLFPYTVRSRTSDCIDSSVRRFLFLLPVTVSLLPAAPFHPASSDPVAAHLNSAKMGLFKAESGRVPALHL